MKSPGPPQPWNPFSWSKRHDFDADLREVDHLVDLWRRTCEAVNLVHRTDTASGTTTITPPLVDITLGPPLILIAQMLPGQVIADYAAAAARLAPTFGTRRFRTTAVWDRMHVRLEALDRDPLTDVVPHLSQPDRQNFLGLTESGEIVTRDWELMPHAVIQGVTRSGKSAWLYSQLAQLARDRAVRIVGSDPSGLLWRPWTSLPAASWRVSGLRSVEEHARLLERLTAEMDRRIECIPPDSDTVTIDTEDMPLVVCFLEEYPGLLRAADALDTKLTKRIRGSVSRLLAESHKAGIRLVLVTQRAEANVIGGFERAMCGFRLSFRVDNTDTVKLLHPSAAVELVDEHLVAPDGVALMTAPGTGLARIRGPWLGGYHNYAETVRKAHA